MRRIVAGRILVNHRDIARGDLADDVDELEESQLGRYRERSAQADELGLADVAEALRPVLEQTQEHVRDLQGALGR